MVMVEHRGEVAKDVRCHHRRPRPNHHFGPLNDISSSERLATFPFTMVVVDDRLQMIYRLVATPFAPLVLHPQTRQCHT